MVAAPFQSRQFGSALMRHYLAAHRAVRRFLLWVKVNNQEALQKYHHFGFMPDSLLDQVLVNDQIQRLTSDL
jgi:ribosomal protein S18 acetylase RimI-like enzyme